jgi:Peptidase propeptide and YPEB domain
MTRRRGIRLGAAVLLGGLLALLPGVPARADPDTPAGREQHDQDVRRARALRDAGEIVPFGEILAHTREYHPGRIIKVKFEDKDGRYTYELEVLDDEGVVWALLFDARTGNLIETMEEQDEIRRDREKERGEGAPPAGVAAAGVVGGAVQTGGAQTGGVPAEDQGE